MFTSRAEYRLLLREDNADLRLTEKARTYGLICDVHWKNFIQKKDSILKEEKRFKKLIIKPLQVDKTLQIKILGKAIEREYPAFDLLKRPNISYDNIMELLGQTSNKSLEIKKQIEILAKYSGYILRQQDQIDKNKKQLNVKIPEDIDYKEVHGLRIEAIQVLENFRPETIDQITRISGITTSTISILLVYLKKKYPKDINGETAKIA